MTDNKQFKNAVRAYAAANDVNYTTALRALTGETDGAASIWERARDEAWRKWADAQKPQPKPELNVQRFHVPPGASAAPFHAAAQELYQTGAAKFVQVTHRSNTISVTSCGEYPFPAATAAPTAPVTPGVLPLGLSTTGDAEAAHLDLDPHLLLLGAPGVGKSRLVQQFGRAAQEWADVYVSDAYDEPHAWNRVDLKGAASSLNDTVAMAECVHSEMKRRQGSRGDGDRPILFILDAPLSLDRGPSGTGADDWRRLMLLLDSIVREGSAAGIHLVVTAFPTRDLVESGLGFARSGFTRILLGGATWAQKIAVFATPPAVLVEPRAGQILWRDGLGHEKLLQQWVIPAA